MYGASLRVIRSTPLNLSHRPFLHAQLPKGEHGHAHSTGRQPQKNISLSAAGPKVASRTLVNSVSLHHLCPPSAVSDHPQMLLLLQNSIPLLVPTVDLTFLLPTLR